MKIIESSTLKQNPFLVPNGYFDALPELVAQRIAPKTIWSLRRTLKPLLSLAASFIVLFGLGYGIVGLTASKGADTDLLGAPSYISHFDAYVLLNSPQDHVELIDSEEIISFLTEHGVSRFSIAALD